MSSERTHELTGLVAEACSLFRKAIQPSTLRATARGIILSVDGGVAQVEGLTGVRSEELMRFKGGGLGIAFNLDPDKIGVVLLEGSERLQAGDEVFSTGRVLDVPVGDALLGRVVDPTGRPLDERGQIGAVERWPIERKAPEIMDRAPVQAPLQTGIKIIDGLVPIGKGQRELILGDRQTGKTAIAIDAILNQKDKDVLCVYCSIGQQTGSLARVVRTLRESEALDYTTVVIASGEESPGSQFIAPYAATTLAEYFMERGRDVLIVYDDLTRHARAYRELSLLLRRPPGREAFPGDIFYIHSRLLERSTHLKEELGGGSLTALPIIETQAQNISDYIPTNLISITDGQVYVSPLLFQKGVLPAVDVGKSVSRVGGKAQLDAYRTVVGDLRLSYAQFEELEAFSRFGTRLDEEAQQTLARGRRIRETMKQRRFETLSAAEQVAVLMAVTRGLLDAVPLANIAEVEGLLRKAVRDHLPDFCRAVERGDPIHPKQREHLLEVLRKVIVDRLPGSHVDD